MKRSHARSMALSINQRSDQEPPEIEDIIVIKSIESQRHSTIRRKSRRISNSSQSEKGLKETIQDAFQTKCMFWFNLILLLSFTGLCIAIGSVKTPEAQSGLKIG